MIATISGPVLEIRIDSLVIGVGGIGMAVQCSPDTIALATITEPVTLYTSLIVREDSLTLFGFRDADSRELFELLQNVSGVGPRLAFGILATLPPAQLRQAIGNEDLGALKKVPGVGAKGAARLVLELKDRIGLTATGTTSSSPTAPSWQGQVHGALVGLGWSIREADVAISALAENPHVESTSVAELLRSALQSLGRNS